MAGVGLTSTPKSKGPVERIIPILMENDDVDKKNPEINTIPKNTAADTANDEDTEEEYYGDEEPSLTQVLVPASSVQEKIIIVFDRGQDECCTNFVLNDGSAFPPIMMLKRSVEVFLRNKNSINNAHQFALVVLNQSNATWVKGFTNRIHDIVQSLNQITDCPTEDVFDLNSLFDAVRNHVELPKTDDIRVPPTYVVRMILIYNRSFTLPVIKETPYISSLLNSVYFTLDIFMTHEPSEPVTNYDKILKTLRKLDRKGFSYFFCVARNACELHVSMAKLLAHPLQRPTQKQAIYNLELSKRDDD